ncbi:MAG: DegV family protein [Anaerolineales bacterium]|jgi:DegV family protein with EDD domain
MADIAIVTDSTAYIPQELVDHYRIHVAPQILIWGDESYLDGVDMFPDEFYAKLQNSKQLPTTSQATVASFHKIFEPLAAEGRQILAIVISEKLSGTLQSARQAKAMFPDATIALVDSRSASMELGFQVLAAARAAEAGKSFQEVVDLAERAKQHTGVYFVVDTLEFLHKGGRIGGAARLLGTAINLKPILQVADGQVESFTNVRTKAKAYNRLLDILEERLQGKANLRLATLHAAAEQDAQSLLQEATKRLNPIETIISQVSPVVGTHVGPGTVGLAFCTDL